MTLTAAEEEIASQYRRMLRMGLPEPAVQHRMAIGRVAQNIQDDVLAGENAELPPGTEEESADQPESEVETFSDEPDLLSTEEFKTPHAEEVNDPESGPPVPFSQHVDDGSQDEYTEELEEINYEEGQASVGHTKSTASFYEEIIIDDDEMIEEIVDDNGEYEEEILEEFVDDIDLDEDDDNDNDGDDNKSDNEVEDGEVLHEADVVGSTTSDHYVPMVDREYQPDYIADSANDFGAGRSISDVESQSLRSKTPQELQPSPSSYWYWIVCFVLVGLFGASGGIGYWLTTLDGDKVSSFEAPVYTNPPTAAPSVPVSTLFDSIQGGCVFFADSNPNPIDQCKCGGEITIIQSDVRERYQYNVEHFIPEYFENYDDEISSCSPKNQALVWISSGNDAVITKEQRAQKFALATVFASLGGTEWVNNENWFTYTDICAWFGVKCDQGHVTELVLRANNLKGLLPSELSLLERLQFLMVANNQVSGPMPVSLFSIESLGTVDVSFNVITGVIPPSIGDAVSLNSLNVEKNLMSGRLTKDIGKTTNLGYLNLKSNQFASELPMELFNLPRLEELNVGNNNFVGTIPEEFSKLKFLTRLTLGPNLFSGTIPTTMGTLYELSYLSISGVADLGGRIPAEFGFQLAKLEELIISGTKISGNIDRSFGSSPSLKSLDFSANQLRSVIPSDLGNLSTLVQLDLSNNFLDGPIPETIGKITTLEQLRLNNNLLQGGIPVSIGNMLSLNTLRLEANRFQDRVADSICDLRQVSLNAFVVDCPIEIEGTEMFGMMCDIPECCTACVPQ
eukprot:CAMPEP_0172365860 /NCGR_PEP_ID=MMETSP1060-20121228/12279_1 /TAXON_ID=37318 /ORGANISM="Pseudo-nitzschia pungens, Strain cf. cingulata" /LENGTH=793 /DNA_ID=CAMNT_0013089433 /DNA_START=184 /DNA_END=2565 /DNA_ORIENTATION=-